MNLFKNKNEEKIIEEKVVKKRYWGRYVSLFFMGVIITSVVLIYRFAQKPAEGTVKSSTEDVKNISAVSDVPETFTGTYVSFMYGNKYSLKSDELSKASADVILERAYLSEVSSVSKKINLTIRSLPSQNLTDDPDYLLRQNNPARYKKENFFLGNVNGVSFVPADDSSFEKTFFVLHRDAVATLVMTAPGSLDEKLSREADSIVKSLTWLK